MFPNVRLVIVAISASLLAIVCAMTLFMGMFAAFGVAHEPFSQLAAAKPPLQIALGGEMSAPVADGKTAPFGVRFQLHAPQVPSGPVIVAVPAALDRGSQPEPSSAVEPVTNSAANSQSNSQSGAQSIPAVPHDEAQPVAQETPLAVPAQATTNQATTNTAARTGERSSEGTDEQSGEAKPDTIAGNDTNGPSKLPAAPAAPERPATASTPYHLAPQIRVASRDADNPASVATSPAPTLARKGIKRRKLAIHLHQSHHFRRPHVHQIGSVHTQAPVQPNGFGQSAVIDYAPAYAQPNGFAQPAYGFAPAAIKPRPLRWRHPGSSGGASGQ